MRKIIAVFSSILLLCISCNNEKEDSIRRFTISDEIDYNIWYNCPYHFKSKINGKDILFVMLAGQASNYATEKPFFKLNDEDYSKVVKKYFPKIYKKYGLKDFRCPEVIYEPELIHLTFMWGKFVGKYRRMGMPGDKVPVIINDSTIYL